ncbi:MAG: DUF2752 domain-containing protein [Firmicutes bacterium]|nr:DUF2752 domain-containing protein [Bacillota bacterium]
MKYSREGLFIFLRLGFYVVGIIIFLVIPTSFFESNFSVCIFKNLTGIECPGCGMTRAFSSLFHGDIIMATEHNKLVIIVFPLFCYVCMKSVLSDLKKLRAVYFPKRTSDHFPDRRIW